MHDIIEKKRLRFITAENGEYERGNVVILTVFIVVVLFGFMGLVYDIGMVYAKKTSMATVLNVMRDSNLDMAILTRNSNSPGADIAQNMTNLARRNGFDGEIKISYYELSVGDNELGTQNTHPYEKRIWVIEMELSDTYDTVFMCIFDGLYKNINPGGSLKKLNLKVSLITGDTNKNPSYVWFPDHYKNGRGKDYNGMWVTQAGSKFSERELSPTTPDVDFGDKFMADSNGMSPSFSSTIADLIERNRHEEF